MKYTILALVLLFVAFNHAFAAECSIGAYNSIRYHYMEDADTASSLVNKALIDLSTVSYVWVDSRKFATGGIGADPKKGFAIIGFNNGHKIYFWNAAAFGSNGFFQKYINFIKACPEYSGK